MRFGAALAEHSPQVTNDGCPFYDKDVAHPVCPRKPGGGVFSFWPQRMGPVGRPEPAVPSAGLLTRLPTVEVRDEIKLLGIRAHPDPVCRVPVFRPELHGLVPVGPTGGADCRRTALDHSAARPGGGEEAMWLRERGVSVEWVNGITAGLAGATNCDIPLTLRGISRGVTLVTAHTQDDSSLNWRALAEGGTKVVVYMGVAKFEEIRQQLLDGAMAADIPVAMIENASLPQQRECRSTLAHMHTDAQAFALKSPAILVIGRVAATDQAARVAVSASA